MTLFTMCDVCGELSSDLSTLVDVHFYLGAKGRYQVLKGLIAMLVSVFRTFLSPYCIVTVRPGWFPRTTGFDHFLYNL